MTVATRTNITQLVEEGVKLNGHKGLTRAQYEGLQRDFDALRDEIRADLGQKDVDYIRNIVRIQRFLEISGRTLIHFSLSPVTFMLGVTALSVSKIVDNMEVGHNVIHGQFDWANDPVIHSRNFEWDNACDTQSWKRTHNYHHHTDTNVLGKDRDYGYGVLRLGDHIPWHPARSIQVAYFALLSIFFQWGVALHELEAEKIMEGTFNLDEKKPFLKAMYRKAGKQIFKDYIFFPALAGPFFWKVMLGNAMANIGRNLWASAVIFCGHFTDDAATFTEAECENETRGQWYYRQLMGSTNIKGGRLLHIMTGHLSLHIEHHLFPDMPAPRYEQIAPRVKEICAKYGLPYNEERMPKLYLQVLKRILKYSFPTQKTATA